MKRLFLTFLFCIVFIPIAFGADRYWVDGGSSTNWNATGNTNWGTASGVQDNASVPGTGDAAIFDSNSTGPAVLSASQTVASLDFTGYTGTWTWNASTTLTVEGNVTLVSGMTFDAVDATRLLYIVSACNLTSAGKKWGTINMHESTTLQDALSAYGQLDLDDGTWDTSNYNVTCNDVRLYDANGKTYTVGSSTVTLGRWYSGSFNTTLNFNTSSHVFNGTNGSLRMQTVARTMYDVTMSDSGTFTHDHNGLTINDLTLSAGTTYTLDAGQTHTVATLTATGTVGNGIAINDGTFSDAAGTNTVSYCTITNNTAQGGATWDATDGTNTDGGGNSGWDFPAAGVVKTYNGLAWASVKTIDGVAVASVKTINGAAAQ
jgi:hypothetical protein